MTTAEFIIALFYRIDNQMHDVPKHPQAALYPSEVVALAMLYALKGGSKRAFLSLALSRLAGVFPSASGAHPAVSPVCRPRRLDGRLFSGAFDVRSYRQLWH